MNGARADAGQPLGYRLSTGVLSRTPHAVLGWAALAGGLIHYALAREKRESRTANLALAPNEVRRAPWRPFQTQALNVLELLAMAARGDRGFLQSMTLHGEENIRTALERGRGVILATLHSGNWELAGLMLADRGYPITTVAGEQLRPGWSDEVRRVKENFGIRVLSPGTALRGLYDDLRSNRAAVLHIDGDIFTGGHEVTFFAQPVKAPRGPAHLSRVLSSPVAFAYCRRTRGRRLEVWIEPPLDPPRDAAEEVAVTRALMRRVEKAVADDPGQWCIFRRLATTATPVKS
jgi:lauroyl/myristoyl acyltransferase